MKAIKTTLFFIAIFAVTGASAQKITRAEYIDRYKTIAIDHMERYGIPASIKMAQGILESDSGNSRLATEANNHFGIKCKPGWTGPTIYHDDDAAQECFRGYLTAEESWADHSEFLDKGQRYQSLFNLREDDYVGWAHGLKAAGYATNPRYPELLIKLIEENGLYHLDRGEDIPATPTPIPTVDSDTVLTNENEKVDADNFEIALYDHNGYEIYLNNGSRFVVSRPGDDLAKIAWLFGISEKRLRRFNDLGKEQAIAADNMIYIQAKNSRSDSGKIIHTAGEGETLHSISQKYGIKIKSLARLNKITAQTGIITGQQIKLR